MFFWRKKTKSFFDFFEEQASLCCSAAALLKHLFSENSDKNALTNQIHAYEHSGDQIVHLVIQQMNTSSFILPLDHEDILDFTKNLDDVLDCIDDSSESFTEIYELNKATPFAQQLVQLILKGTEVLEQTCSLLRSPSQSSAKVLGNCLIIHNLENQADQIKKEALKQLFSRLKNANLDLPTYLAWQELYNTLEQVTDRIDDCANISEQIVMKYS